MTRESLFSGFGKFGSRYISKLSKKNNNEMDQ